MLQATIQGRLTRALLWLVVMVNVLIATFHAIQTIQPKLVWLSEQPKATYTWQHLDYPHAWPIGQVDNVAMTLFDTVHFGMNATDTFAEEEWHRALLMLNIGHGRVRLGPERHVYILTHFHQLHCVRVFQHALLGFAGSDESQSTDEHVEHCLDYLRQTIMCHAEVQLEKGDFMTRSWETDRVGGTLVCHDWEKIYADIAQNYQEWEDWVKVWN